MQLFFISVLLSLVFNCSAVISGPYLFWGPKKVLNLQSYALIEANENDLTQLYRNVKTIVLFVRNTTNQIEGIKYPKFQNLVKSNAWSYLPQRNLAAEPFNYNTNIEVISLTGHIDEDDEQLISGYNNAVTIYGIGEVLGILANREEEAHFMAKREAKNENDSEEHTATAQTPSDETDKSFIYIAEGNKAALYVNLAPVLKLGNLNETIYLVEHMKGIYFDDQKVKGYSRLNIIFAINGEKLFLRFNFTLIRGTWYMKAVEVENKDIKSVLPVVGNSYSIPSAPTGFSYRCSARDLIFSNGNDSLVLTDYQVQPWLSGRTSFGDTYDCVGFITTPILAGLLVTFLLCSILSIGIMAMLDMHTPNRFESSRSKQLTFTVQD